MPIYEFECRSCHYVFEKYTSGRDSKEPEACPRCHSTETEKVFSVFSASCDSSSTAAGGGCGSRGFS